VQADALKLRHPLGQPGSHMIFITGGAGYIGSHTCVELLDAGHDVTVFDNFCNSQPEALARVTRITGKKIKLIEGDIRDQAALTAALQASQPHAVIHFAGLKAVGESVAEPLRYYDNNVLGTLKLLQAMQTCGVKTLVFSSSATVYGNPQRLPLTEDHPLSATNPYGQTKLVIEDMLRDLGVSDPVWRIGILRYFNPVGAHASGLIGEDPQGVPNNLLPFVAQVAVGRRAFLNVWGNDYPTPDGTGVRDYIHVVDLALGHLARRSIPCNKTRHAVLRSIWAPASATACWTWFARSSRPVVAPCLPGLTAPSRRCGGVLRRPRHLRYQLLGWQAKRHLQTMCEDSWRWQSGNPNGYSSGA
jgi:UDP-glucose 4-epimerase